MKIDDFTGRGFPYPHVMNLAERRKLCCEHGEHSANFADADLSGASIQRPNVFSTLEPVAGEAPSFARATIVPDGLQTRIFVSGTAAIRGHATIAPHDTRQQLDLAEPVDFVDPQGGGDYFAAGTQLSKISDANGGDPDAPVDPIPYFENVFPFMANLDYDGESATQAIYTNEWAPYRYDWGATTSLSDIDFYCYYGCPDNWQPHFWHSQFSSLYALSSIGMSYYNAGQITLRHPMSHGLMMDFSYTLSNSIDMGSDTERSTENGGFSTNSGSFSTIQNTWNPALNRGPSDFDTRHLITADWVYQLPFGRGRAFAGNAGGVLTAIIGGWQNSGITRWSSGLPWTLFEPGWTTNWEQEAYGVVTGDIKLHKHIDSNGNPQYFEDPDAINSGVYTGGPVRLPYPGEAGQRNNLRGDGYFDVDSGLDKSWKIRETGTLKFAWEVYNVFNSVRFDPYWIGAGLTGGDLGIASATLTQPRRMQFSLRYDF